MPRKLTVTRVAALRSRQLTQNGIRAFHRAASADGADRSGLTALTYATMMTYAVDAAVAVALANTLFFAAATAESKTNVALYLAITVAPFAVVAPVIGPLLDRLQRGRRAALAVSFAGRAVLAVVMALNYDSWLLYPAALGMLVLSKSFVVLKAAVTPRVLPPAITLVTTNARLTTFGLIAGGVFGAVAAGVAALSGSPGALIFTAALAVGGAVLCLRIPRWVESTAGEVPAALRSTSRGRAPPRRPISRGVLVQLWGNGSIRILTGFLTLFVAFVVKAQHRDRPAAPAAAARHRRRGRRDGLVPRQRHRLPAPVRPPGDAWCCAASGPRWPWPCWPRCCPGSPPPRAGRAGRGHGQRAGQGVPGRGDPARPARGVAGLGVRPVGDGAAAVLGVRRRARGAAAARELLAGFTVVAAVVALAGIQTGLLSRGRSLLPFLSPRAPRPAEARSVG